MRSAIVTSAFGSEIAGQDDGAVEEGADGRVVGHELVPQAHGQMDLDHVAVPDPSDVGHGLSVHEGPVLEDLLHVQRCSPGGEVQHDLLGFGRHQRPAADHRNNFAVTPDLLIDGLKAALIIGVIGGFFPAIRAARLPVAQALREL